MADGMTLDGLRPPRVVDGRLTLELDGDVGALRSGQQALAGFLQRENVDAAALYRTELVYEELVVNVVRHAYADREASDCRIDVRVRVDDDEIVLEVEDDGPEFDPLQVPEPRRSPNLRDAAAGGLGLKLVRMGTRRMAYQREVERNRVTVSIGRS